MKESRGFLSTGFQCLGINSQYLKNELLLREKFIKEVVTTVPGIENSEKLNKMLEDIFNEMELESDVLENMKKTLQEKRKLQNIENDEPIKIKSSIFNKNRKSSDSSQTLATVAQSVNQNCPSTSPGRDKDIQMNNKLERYFKVLDKGSKTLFEKTLDLKQNVNSFNNSLTNSSNMNQNSNQSFASFGYYSSRDYQNQIKTVTTCYPLNSLKKSPSQNSFSKIELEIPSTPVHGSNNIFSHNENSKMSFNQESSIKRPLNINYSSAKSTSFSQISNSNSQNTNISNFSFNPNRFIRSSAPASDSNSQININIINNNNLVKLRGGGINSMLASKINDMPKTNKNSTSNNDLGKTHLTNSGKRRKKEKSTLFGRFFEKLGARDTRSISIESNPSANLTEKEETQGSLQQLVGKQFYIKQNLLKKSPNSEMKNKNLESPQPTEKKIDTIEIVISKNSSKNNSNRKKSNKSNELLKLKRNSSVMTRSRSRQSLSNLKTMSRTRKKIKKEKETSYRKCSNTSEEDIIVYCTPNKTSNIFTNSNVSPGFTTRKNLLNLFSQVNKG